MKTNKLLRFAISVAAITIIASACSNKPYNSSARYWHGHKHVSHYEKWK